MECKLNYQLTKAVQGSSKQSKSIWVKSEKTTSFLRKSSPKVERAAEVVQSHSCYFLHSSTAFGAFAPYWLSNSLSKLAYLDTVWSPQFSFNPFKAREMTSICCMKEMGYGWDQICASLHPLLRSFGEQYLKYSCLHYSKPWIYYCMNSSLMQVNILKY